MGVQGTHLRGDHRAAGIRAAREWRTAMKPTFDALYGAEGEMRQGVTEGGNRALDQLDLFRSTWAFTRSNVDQFAAVRARLDDATNCEDADDRLTCLVDAAARLIDVIDRAIVAQPSTGAQA